MQKFLISILLVSTLVSCGGKGKSNSRQNENDLTYFFRYSEDLGEILDEETYLEKHSSLEIEVADDHDFKSSVIYTVHKEEKGSSLTLKGGYPHKFSCSKLLMNKNKIVGQWLCQMKELEGDKHILDRELLMTISNDGKLIFHKYYEKEENE